jgi:uncharacterized protein YndB with AHSA1/START domain
MNELPHNLNRTVLIRATPEIVFSFFTDSARWASWWGAGSTIDASRIYIRHPNGVEVSGDIIEVEPMRRIVFTYGYASGAPMPPGASRVTITLEPDPEGTRLRLFHEFAEAPARDLHIQGWRFQLSLFGNVASNAAFAHADETVDAWFAAWLIADASERNAALDRVAAPGICFRDRYGLLDGAADISAHIAAALRFMPGMGLKRKGAVRHCQGTVLADWGAPGPDGVERMSGTTVFTLAPDGRIQAATGITNP